MTIKPEHLARATELYEKWNRLRDLEYAAHVSYGTRGRLKELAVYGAGLKSFDCFDLSDLRTVGLSIQRLETGILDLIKLTFDDAIMLLLDELRILGVDADQMAGDRETSMRSWKDAK